MSSSYSSGGYPSNRLPPKISYSSGSGSRTSDYLASSHGVIETKYRSGAADGFYKSIKDIPSSRGGAGTVLIQDKK
ncbi:predicted protein [Chaetomium globosum CBS 148.51]|jgi:hypothetical protein|uniref:Uncharacterized protein n=1 Tax=Chaetomium globosum (strain ATCC 6205 / CBS 148.51 / DSM 1962 / NBRC 6347 / NRRL 1970) TaxID=306901 RepID=Q2GMG6_CHAGB|nr:uncharacterized protein CHGG_10838 [Chaetomium globosum CBS 148.51]EAQ83020.1 predicted protein [Chaetomium globosum CBS 148.51]